MKIPVVTGDGRAFELDSDDYPRLVLLPEVCEGIDPRLWDLFAEPDHQEPERGFGVSTQANAPHRAVISA